jgi:hypothetical protein
MMRRREGIGCHGVGPRFEVPAALPRRYTL